MTFVVGLTGGIGSGKTVASDHFATLGVPVIDTDIIARQVVSKGQATLTRLAEEFGSVVLQANGELDRAAMREIAFSSAQNKAKLDAITHPAIRTETFAQIEQATYPYCIVVIPLLTSDSVFSELLDRILTVSADTEIRIKRVQTRSELSRSEVERIMATQLTDRQRQDFADDTIVNNGSIKQAHQQIERLHQLYLELSAA